MKLEKSSILITGGANGIGQGIVKRLIQEGCIVSVIDKDEEALRRLAKEHPEITYAVCDLTQFDQVVVAVNSIIQQVQVIHGLINNAGIIKNSPLINLLAKENKTHSVQLWHDVIATNLTSVFYVTVNIAEHMIAMRTRGVIVNICSISANGNAGQTAYSAAKAGVIGMSRTWAKELGPMGIRCVPISPGFVDTPSTSAALSESVIEHVVKSTPNRRLGDVTEIADAVVFSLTNDFYNGKLMEIDGGLVY